MNTTKGLSGNQLKIIGIVLMTINHLDLLFYPNLEHIPWLNFLVLFAGPAVAPLFIFLSSEGYYYTRNKQKYLFTLLLGFWGMSLVKFLLTHLLNLSVDYENLLFMNIFGGIFQAVLAMYLYDSIVKHFKEKKRIIAILLICLLVLLLSSLFWMSSVSNPMYLKIGMDIVPVVVEGAPILPLMGLLFHIFRNNKKIILLIALLFVLPNSIIDLLSNGLSGSMWSALLLPLFILFYNGQRGNGPNKYSFYIYYPLHIAFFVLINYVS